MIMRKELTLSCKSVTTNFALILFKLLNIDVEKAFIVKILAF